MKNIRITLRTKPIKNNKESIRLDCAPPLVNPATGKKTRWIYTGLFLYAKPKNQLEREHNKETKALAESIRAQRLLEVQAGQYGFIEEKAVEVNLIEYYTALAIKRDNGEYGVWQCSLKHIKEFFEPNKTLNDLKLSECEAYREYLLQAAQNNNFKTEKTGISQNTASVYFSKLKTALKEAYKKEILKTDLNGRLPIIRATETDRQFLSMEELQALVNADCRRPELKQAALFSALTGMRHSDIKKLTWCEVQHSKTGGYFLRYRQQKTGGSELLPVSEQAVSLLGERGEDSSKVFELDYSKHNNDLLKEWVKNAGITKHITFHSFRHTYATLQISLGTDLFTLSKMLGHRELKTTQIYAKVMDKAKQEAANKIKLNF
ncbi:site-specific integrase [Adhaeribacter sp. BT258]|uniref:Site-specific integrase n=1 Tax=Adhaeribacter terrigena TaxID=2793070 RepID=A0ABS1C3D8_9BACT|nr:site-specific integrase [Adhaeribacter terrigena]MBK0403877.1 site-specific integrase [Adhaeribacter terrigena]